MNILVDRCLVYLEVKEVGIKSMHPPKVPFVQYLKCITFFVSVWFRLANFYIWDGKKHSKSALFYF